MGFWNNKKPQPEAFVTKENLRRIQADISKIQKNTQQQQQPGGAAGKLLKGLSKGFNDIAESLSTPSTKRRPRISQMPAKRPPIASSSCVNPISGSHAGMKRHRISHAPRTEE